MLSTSVGLDAGTITAYHGRRQLTAEVKAGLIAAGIVTSFSVRPKSKDPCNYLCQKTSPFFITLYVVSTNVHQFL